VPAPFSGSPLAHGMARLYQPHARARDNTHALSHSATHIGSSVFFERSGDSSSLIVPGCGVHSRDESLFHFPKRCVFALVHREKEKFSR
jgi:hypothetical protein